MTTNRTVRSDDPRIKRKSTPDLPSGLSEMFLKLEQMGVLENRVRALEVENKRIWAAIDKMADQHAGLAKMAASGDALDLYRKTHEELHKQLDSSIKNQLTSVRQTVSVARAEMSKNFSEQIASAFSKIQLSLASLLNKKDTVPKTETPSIVQAPQKIDVKVERGTWDFNISRDEKGLLKKVIASPKG